MRQALCLAAGTPPTRQQNPVCDVTSTRNEQQPSLAYSSLTIHYEEKLKEEEMGGTCGMHGREMCAELRHFMLSPRCK